MKKNQFNKLNNLYNRRTFISTGSKALGSAILAGSAVSSFAEEVYISDPVTVGQIMDTFISEVTSTPLLTTVDTLKAGDRHYPVTGIVTTMFATIEVIRKAIDLKCNFIIAHEPTFYNHLDDTDWLKDDEVYRYKINLLNQHKISVWRNHDYIHRHQPDGVKSTVIEKLGWSQHFNSATNIAIVPSISLTSLITQVKQQLGIQTARYIGNLNQQCKKILVMPGASGGKRQIEAMSQQKPDVLICGEIQEWETAEYVRDAQAKGDQLSLIVLGHIASEEPGSEYISNWIKKVFPPVAVHHIPAGNSLKFM